MCQTTELDKEMYSLFYLIVIAMMLYMVYAFLSMLWYAGDKSIFGVIMFVISMFLFCQVVYYPGRTLRIVFVCAIIYSIIKLIIECVIEFVKYIKKLFNDE